MAFCSTVGQAIFHTAGTIGPSTMDRSNERAPAPPAGPSAIPADGSAVAASSGGSSCQAGIVRRPLSTRDHTGSCARMIIDSCYRMALIARRTSACARTTAGWRWSAS